MMDTNGVHCHMCSAVTATNAEMENHVLTKHANIFRKTSEHVFSDEFLKGCVKKEESLEQFERREGMKREENVTDLKSKIGLKFELVVIEGKQCSNCNFMATDQTLLNNHMMEKHPKQEEVKTQNNLGHKFQEKKKTLNNRFKSSEQSKTVICEKPTDNGGNGKVPNKKSVKCLECDKSYRCLAHLKRHQQSIHTREASDCLVCGKSFDSVYYLHRHCETVHGRKRYTCKSCPKSFIRLQQLKRHEETIHKSEVEPVLCSLCAKPFTSNYFCNQHYQDIHGTAQFKCKTCEKSFGSDSHLKRHQQSTHSQKGSITALQCLLCERSFFDLYSLNRHCNLAHSGETFNCVTCERVFERFSWLQSHRQTFHNPKSKVLPCGLCKKSFVDLFSRNKHYNDVHSGKRFNCPDCDASFKHSPDLEKHRLRIHSLEAKTCVQFDKSFLDFYHCKRHYNEVHRERIFKCKVCEKSFGRISRLISHEQRHTNLTGGNRKKI